jgi:hypothetical protein
MSHNAVNEETMQDLPADDTPSPVNDSEALEQVSAANRLVQLAAAARARSDVAVLAAQQAAQAARTTAAARLASRANADEKAEIEVAW